MTGVDRDDEIARIRRRMFDFDGLVDATSEAIGTVEIDHQPVTIMCIRRAQETFGLAGPGKIEHQSKIARWAVRHAHVFYLARAGWRVARGFGQTRARDVENDALRMVQQQQAVLRGARKIHHYPRAVGSRPQAHGAHVDG